MTRVEWTEAAQAEYLLLLEQAYARSTDAAIELDDKLEALINNLKRFKYLCPASLKFPKVRRCVITPYVSLVYLVGPESIIIISVFDNRGENSFTSM